MSPWAIYNQRRNKEEYLSNFDREKYHHFVNSGVKIYPSPLTNNFLCKENEINKHANIWIEVRNVRTIFIKQQLTREAEKNLLFSFLLHNYIESKNIQGVKE